MKVPKQEGAEIAGTARAFDLHPCAKHKKCTLPPQALSCSGSKGLSQPDPVPVRASKAGAGADTDTPGAFSHHSNGQKTRKRRHSTSKENPIFIPTI